MSAFLSLPTYRPDKVSYALERMLKTCRKWDDHAELGMLHMAPSGGVRCLPMPIPAAMWNAARDPKNLLRDMVDLLTEEHEEGSPEHTAVSDLRKGVPPGFIGMYLRVEGWRPPAGTEWEIQRRREAGGSVPRFKDMEGRGEAREALAVDRHGRLYMTSQHREDGIVRPCNWEKMPGEKDPEKVRVTGTVPDLLVQLVMALQPLPTRT